ncbi:MAG: extracellular solute-binding protein, partial [Acidobacteriota bacterium]|nr:extracellular solute-binding protein [Acidobacteriota bacterium]
RVLATPFEQESGARIEEVGLRSADQVARLRIERAQPSFDVLWIDMSEALLLAREGLLLTVDASTVPSVSHVPDELRTAAGIAPPAFASALGFLYNTQRLPTPPASWAALWSPSLGDQLALFDFGSNLGPMTLVMAARLAGGGVDDIEPGFSRLADLLPNVHVFGTSGPANNSLVAQGEVGLTLGLANQARDLAATGAPVAWLVPEEGALALPQGFQIVAGTSRRDLALQFLEFVFRTDTQTRLANQLLFVVSNRDATLAPENAALVPVHRILYFDLEAIGARRGAWTNRFNREIAARP